MNYNLINIYTNDPYTEEILTEKILKTIPYNAKIKDKRTKKSSFLYALIPNQINYNFSEWKTEITSFLQKHWPTYNKLYLDNNEQIWYSLWHFFKEWDNLSFSFDFISWLDDSCLDIYYTDGSSSSTKTTSASFACVEINEESYDPKALHEDLTDSFRLYTQHSGIIENATNNIGELSGIQAAVSLRRDNDVQVIVSDSLYSINCFREWIYAWKKNGYKGSSSKKPILNCELIKSIQSDIENSKKIYLFQWTKSHVDTPFNEMCDRLAKDKLGIE